MNRPTLPELAKARADLQRFLATNPNHELAPVLRVMLRATAPITKEEAIPTLVYNANKQGGWLSSPYDAESARIALDGEDGTWESSIRAQWATLVHFYGGAE